MSPYTLHRIPGEDSPDAALVVCGIGSRGAPVPTLARKIQDSGMEVHYMDRHGDERLAGGPGAIAEYTQALSGHVATITQSGRRVHMVATSFGAWLTLLAMREGMPIRSLALLAPLIDPQAALGRTLEVEDGFYRMPTPFGKDPVLIRTENLGEAPAIGPGHRIDVPAIAIIGSKDEIESPKNLNRLTGGRLSLHEINTNHRGVLTNKHARDLLAEFYRQLLLRIAA